MNIYMLVVQTAWDCMVVVSSATMAAVLQLNLQLYPSFADVCLKQSNLLLEGPLFGAVRPP